MNSTTPPSALSSDRIGIWNGLIAYGLWGLMPLYLKFLTTVPPLEVVAWRIIGSMVLLFVLVLLQGRFGEVRAALRGWTDRARLLLSTGLIATNWLVFIWAVFNDRILEASLGYYITPLVSAALGMAFLRERPSRASGIAMILAMAGVGAQLVLVGSLPAVALILAFSFGLYGLVHKTSPTGPVVGLVIETSILGPFSLLFLAWLGFQGRASFGAGSPSVDLLLLLAGLITAIPLLCFASAARRIPLITLGFIQFVAPTGQLLLAVLLYGEPMGVERIVTFVCIWSALVLFSSDRWRRTRRVSPQVA